MPSFSIGHTDVDTVVSSARTDFGFNDNYGRPLGFRNIIVSFEVTEEKDDNGWAPRAVTSAGTWHRVHGTPLRDGQPYGPSFNYAYLKTLDEAKAYAAKRVEDCRKRYVKKFVKAAA